MGGGKGSSTQQAVVTPEQTAALQAQTKFLTDTAFPAYQKTLAGAGDVYGNTSKATTAAATNATNVAAKTGDIQMHTGAANLSTGSQGLASLFDPQYEEQQVQAALQSGRESARETQGAQNAMYGGAGGLGSARMALADSNLAGLNTQRQATAAASARAGVQANKAAAASALMTGGQSQLGAANMAAGSQIGYAGSPQDLYSKYASVVFGTPQASTTPNFAGTQGSTGSSKSSGIKF
tara:strand:- start:3978 stop:4688 length:711 start_codon:yes stop_codon:yes gene_type:complete